MRAQDAPDRRAAYLRRCEEAHARRMAAHNAEVGSDGEKDPHNGAPVLLDDPRTGELVQVGRFVAPSLDSPASSSTRLQSGTQLRRARDRAYRDAAAAEWSILREVCAQASGGRADEREVLFLYNLLRGGLDEAHWFSAVASAVSSVSYLLPGPSSSDRESQFIFELLRIGIMTAGVDGGTINANDTTAS